MKPIDIQKVFQLSLNFFGGIFAFLRKTCRRFVDFVKKWQYDRSTKINKNVPAKKPGKKKGPMTEKELRKLSRYQLLELLIMQTSRADTLQAQLDEARQELESRQIRMQQIGSIAEASVQIGGLMEAAQNTADLFLETTKKRLEQMEQDKAKEAALIVENARREARWIMESAKMRAGALKKEDD